MDASVYKKREMLILTCAN